MVRQEDQAGGFVQFLELLNLLGDVVHGVSPGEPLGEPVPGGDSHTAGFDRHLLEVGAGFFGQFVHRPSGLLGQSRESAQEFRCLEYVLHGDVSR